MLTTPLLRRLSRGLAGRGVVGSYHHQQQHRPAVREILVMGTPDRQLHHHHADNHWKNGTVLYPGGQPSSSSRKQKRRRKHQQIPEAQRKSWNPSYKFQDTVRLRVAGGSGGRGSGSMEKTPRKKRRKPDGGNGGMGGSVVIVVDDQCQALLSSQTSTHIVAANGANGASRGCHGAAGSNTIVRVPPGVLVKRVLEWNETYDARTGLVWKDDEEEDEDGEPDVPSYWWDDELEDGDDDDNSDEDDEERFSHEFQRAAFIGTRNSTPRQHHRRRERHPAAVEAEENFEDVTEDDHDEEEEAKHLPYGGRTVVTLADLDQPGAHVVVARGGRGGLGTGIFTNNRGLMPPPKFIQYKAQPQPGEMAYIELELKLIADIGLVGFPNAGKSSVLRALSAATPAVAPYPFTTLHPLVGCVEYQDGMRVQVADIPGLIDGASQGRGQGHEFLRHIERTKALLYMVDVASVDLRDPLRDLEVLVEELESYSSGAEATYDDGRRASLLERPALVAGNKVDLLHPDKELEIEYALQEKADALGVRLAQDVLMISAGVTGAGLGNLAKALRTVAFHEDAEESQTQQHAESRLADH